MGEQGYLSYKIENGEVTITKCDKSASGELVIPDTIEGNPVTRIGSYAFRECTSLTSITIGNGVTSIGTGAFWKCTSLASVMVGKGVTRINHGAFKECSSLVIIIFKGNAPEIKRYWSGPDGFPPEPAEYPGAFSDVYATAYYPAGNSTWTKDVMQDITWAPYERHEGYLFEIKNGKVTIIKRDKSASGELVIPDAIEGYPVTSIGDYAFSGCISLTSITISDGVTSIGERAFIGCTSLTSITIPNSVTRINDGAFKECRSLTSITFKGNAPEIRHRGRYLPGNHIVLDCVGAFADVTATAYYPADNDTWTKFHKSEWRYGGSIKWVPYERHTD